MSWLDDHPQIRNLRCGAADLNGQARGKMLPRALAAKPASDGIRMPLSVLNVDITGEDIADSPLLFDSGDADGVFLPTERGFLPMPWLHSQSALLPMWGFDAAGTPFAGDPRHALAAVIGRYAERGLTPVVATELEFYLIDDSGAEIAPPKSPRSGKRRRAADILSLGRLEAFDAFFNELYDACTTMDIPAEAALSESGTCQFEINLTHQSNALKAADDAWLFKMLVKGLARKHGMAASFMAKPYADEAGNGLHTHFSVLDREGANIFADGSEAGTPALRHAIAGCLAATADLTLIFAPHENSYARLVPGAHAPTALCWAYENRTAMLRVPGGAAASRRIEHRLAGGDVNPYLFLAAVLGAALIGIEDAQDPPAPITGNAYAQALPQVPRDWPEAIARFGASPYATRIFPALLIDNLLRTKRQELQTFGALDPIAKLALTLDTV